MAEDNTLNESAEYNGGKDEESPILIAQRYLNIFHQIHIFNAAKKAEFEKSLIEMPEKVKETLPLIPGGRILLEHIHELCEQKGISDDSEDILQQSQELEEEKLQHAQVPQTATAIAGGNISLAPDFADKLANSLAAALKKNSVGTTPASNGTPASGGDIKEFSEVLGKSFNAYAGNIQNVTQRLLTQNMQQFSQLQLQIQNQLQMQTKMQFQLQEQIRNQLHYNSATLVKSDGAAGTSGQSGNITATTSNNQTTNTINSFNLDTSCFSDLAQVIREGDVRRQEDFMHLITILNQNVKSYANNTPVKTQNTDFSGIAQSITQVLRENNRQQIEAIKEFGRTLSQTILASQQALAQNFNPTAVDSLTTTNNKNALADTATDTDTNTATNTASVIPMPQLPQTENAAKKNQDTEVKQPKADKTPEAPIKVKEKNKEAESKAAALIDNKFIKNVSSKVSELANKISENINEKTKKNDNAKKDENNSQVAKNKISEKPKNNNENNSPNVQVAPVESDKNKQNKPIITPNKDKINSAKPETNTTNGETQQKKPKEEKVSPAIKQNGNKANQPAKTKENDDGDNKISIEKIVNNANQDTAKVEKQSKVTESNADALLEKSKENTAPEVEISLEDIFAQAEKNTQASPKDDDLDALLTTALTENKKTVAAEKSSNKAATEQKTPPAADDDLDTLLATALTENKKTVTTEKSSNKAATEQKTPPTKNTDVLLEAFADDAEKKSVAEKVKPLDDIAHADSKENSAPVDINTGKHLHSYNDAMQKIKEALHSDDSVSLSDIDVKPVALGGEEADDGANSVENNTQTDDFVLDEETFEKLFNLGSETQTTENTDDEWEYVDENGNPVSPDDSDEWEYVDENGNPVNPDDSGEWEYVDENGNPVTPNDNDEWEYVDEDGNPIK